MWTIYHNYVALAIATGLRKCCLSVFNVAQINTVSVSSTDSHKATYLDPVLSKKSVYISVLIKKLVYTN